MAPLTKDTLEVSNPAGEAAVSHTIQSKPSSGHMRSDAVSLEVAVRVHGSKVKGVVLGATPHTEPFEEQTSTMIIFPQGAVLRMNTAVTVGQMLVLTNLKSRQDAICRVVKVRPNANLAAYIEVEFTQRQPGYWGVQFPGDADAASSKTSNAAPTISAGNESSEKLKPAPDISWAPAPPPSAAPSKPVESESTSKEFKPAYEPPPPPIERFVPAVRPEAPFISIGSQEEVQPAASATALTKTKRPAFDPAPPKSPAPIEFPSAPPAAPPAALSIADLQGDGDVAPSLATHAADVLSAEDQTLGLAATPTSENPRSTFGSFAGGNTLAAARAVSPDDFGARLDSGAGASAGPGAPSGVNWMLIAAGVAVLTTVVGGGLYFRNSSANGRAANAHTPVATQQLPQAEPAAGSSNSAQAPAGNSSAQPLTVPSSSGQLSPANGANAAASSNPSNAGRASAGTPQQSAASSKSVAPSVTPDMMSQSLSSHPISTQRTDAGGGEAAPALDAPADSGGGSAALSGISSAPNVPTLAPPTIPADVPAKIGGDVKEPRLIASAVPVYPMGAKQAGVEGDVVVNTTIDKNGSVVGMKVISGPALLRQAALDALRRWKYEPSMLNGQPIAVQMQVTIKFRR
jgi:TonB family protein